MSKRNRESGSFIGKEEPADLYIHVAGRDAPFTANRGLLKYFSQSVLDLPAAESGPTTWDLRGVVLEDETTPVDASTVQLWLNIIYSRVDFTRVRRLPSNLTDGLRLLKFADYAGTCAAVLQDTGSKMADGPDAFLELEMGPASQQQQQQQQEQQQQRCTRVRLKLHDFVYCCMAFGLMEYGTRTHRCLVPSADFETHRAPFIDAASTALEAALYLAARLELLPLVRTLRAFTRTQLLSGLGGIVLTPGAVYSPRVLRSMPHEVLLEGFLESTFLDTNARVELAGGSGIEAVFRPGPAAGWFGASVGERKEGMQLCVRPGPGIVLEETNSDVYLRITSFLGGLSAEEREAQIRQAMAAMAAPDAEAGEGGADQ